MERQQPAGERIEGYGKCPGVWRTPGGCWSVGYLGIDSGKRRGDSQVDNRYITII